MILLSGKEQEIFGRGIGLWESVGNEMEMFPVAGAR